MRKEFHLSSSDRDRLNGFWDRLKELSDRHKVWYKKISAVHSSTKITNYLDQNIRKNYGDDVAAEGQILHDDWLKLRVDIEQFLEGKHFSLKYDSYYWTEYAVISEVSHRDYEGNIIRNPQFNLGPADWCANTLNGVSNEFYQRRRIQRIERYTVWGLAVGTVSLLIGISQIVYSLL